MLLKQVLWPTSVVEKPSLHWYWTIVLFKTGFDGVKIELSILSRWQPRKSLKKIKVFKTNGLQQVRNSTSTF